MSSSNASLSGTRQMTQAAKAQEPSMEEILASIRRIIADDDASKSVLRAPEPARAEPPPIPPAPPPAPPVAAPRPSYEAESRMALEPQSPMVGEAMAEQAPDIPDLTDSMAAPMPQSSPGKPIPESQPAPQFRTIDGSS